MLQSILVGVTVSVMMAGVAGGLAQEVAEPSLLRCTGKPSQSVVPFLKAFAALAAFKALS